MKHRIFDTLRLLRAYALTKAADIFFYYHEENSSLMRFANSAVSLNTCEHLIRLEITACRKNLRGSYEMITAPDSIDEMKRGIDTAVEMLEYVKPLSYCPAVPVFTRTFIDESGYDARLASLTGGEKLAYFNEAAAGLENGNMMLSGIFSSGTSVTAQINTRSEEIQYFIMTDAQISAVLSHASLKWEVIAEQSAYRHSSLDTAALRDELDFLSGCYARCAPVRIEPGIYDIVFGHQAVSELVSVMNYVGINGGSMKRGYSFLSEGHVGRKVFSEKVTLTDDPSIRETFPFKRDLTGMPRERYLLIENGVFNGFTWTQDDADEFNEQPTGHTVPRKSLCLAPGSFTASSIKELAGMPRDRDILYIPYLHYLNIVSPSQGLITASSRFGALLLKRDRTIQVPYNVRLTHSLTDFFGHRLEWLSSVARAYNNSGSYGARNPSALSVPVLVAVNGLEVSHSNSSY